MKVSEQFQIETDEKGNPIAFHKLRSIHINSQPTPSIKHANFDPSLIAKMANNEIEYMPRNASKISKNTKIDILQIILTLVIIFTASILINDFFTTKIGKEESQELWESSEEDPDEYQSELESEYEKDNENEENENFEEKELEKIISDEPKIEQEKYEESQPNIEVLNAHEKIYANTQERTNPNTFEKIESTIKSQNSKNTPNTPETQWIHIELEKELKIQKLQHKRIKTNNPNEPLRYFKLKEFKNKLVYQISSSEWYHFLSQVYEQFKCNNINNNNNKEHDRSVIEEYCKEIEGELQHNEEL